MIQFNLLPDVKLEYIRAQRTRRLVFSTAFLATVASVGLMVLLLLVGGLEKVQVNHLTSQINSQTQQLQKKPQINKILTVQNQLQSLTNLHATKPAASRLFDDLNASTPDKVDITNFTIDFTAQTATITGTADALSSINQYVDTLKFTTYTSDGHSQKTPAFSNVVLTNFGLTNSTATNSQAPNPQPASYTITLAYDKNIFDITQSIKLVVPQQTTTRSNVAQPSDLFQKTPTPSTTPTGGKQ